MAPEPVFAGFLSLAARSLRFAKSIPGMPPKVMYNVEFGPGRSPHPSASGAGGPKNRGKMESQEPPKRAVVRRKRSPIPDLSTPITIRRGRPETPVGRSLPGRTCPWPSYYTGDPAWLQWSRTASDTEELLRRSHAPADGRLIEAMDGDHFEYTGWLIQMPGFPRVKLKVLAWDDAPFYDRLEKALAVILSTRSGWEWLSRMAMTGKEVSFVRSTLVHTSVDYERGCHWSELTTSKDLTAQMGMACHSWVYWDPEQDWCFQRSTTREGRPGPAVCLFHEMVHALQMAEGVSGKGPVQQWKLAAVDRDGKPVWRDREGNLAPVDRNGQPLQKPEAIRMTLSTPVWRGDERSATGLPKGSGWQILPGDVDYSNSVPTENSLRDELDIPRRRTFFAPNVPIFHTGLKFAPPF